MDTGIFSALAARGRILHDSPMSRLAKRIVKYSLVFLVLLAAVLLAAPFFLDTSHYKRLILEQAEQATGRKIEIGEWHASFFPWIGVRVDDVHIANRRGFSSTDFLQIKSLDVRLALLPLLRKQIEIKRFVLDSPRLMLERDVSGAGNWEDLFAAPNKHAPTGNVSETVRTPATGGGWLIALSAKSLRMLDGEVYYRDSRLRKDVVLSGLDMTADDVQLDHPVHVRASGKFSGNAFSVRAEVGPLGDLSKLHADRLPVQADIRAKSIALEQLVTFIPVLVRLGKGMLDMDVHLEQRPDGMRVTAGSLTLHGAHAADVAWKIEMPKPDRMKLDQVVVHMGGEKIAEMTGSVHGTGRRLRYQVRLHTPTLSREQLSAWIPGLQALYAAHPDPWEQIKLGVLATGDTKHVELQDLQLILNKELVQVSGNIRFGADPVVRLRIASKILHIDPWLPMPEQKEVGNQAIYGDSSIKIAPYAHAEGVKSGQQPTGNLNADTRMNQVQAVNVPANTGTAMEPDWRFLQSWRVTAGLQVDHLFLHGLELAHLHAMIVGKHGIFNIEPFRFDLAGGRVSEKARLNVGRYPARWTESTKVRGVRMQPVFKALENTDMLAGVVRMDMKLKGIGLLPETALRHLKGTGNVLLRDGMIKGFDIAETLRDIIMPAQRNDPEQTDFSQLSGSFKVNNGVVSNDDLFMASPLFRLTGYGRVNLIASTMDYHVKPRLVGSLAGQGDTEAARKGLEIPLRITGPLHAPIVKVEMDIKTLRGNIGNVRDMLRDGKGALKGLLKGMLQKRPASGHPAPGVSPAPSQVPARAVDRLLRKLKISGF